MTLKNATNPPPPIASCNPHTTYKARGGGGGGPKDGRKFLSGRSPPKNLGPVPQRGLVSFWGGLAWLTLGHVGRLVPRHLPPEFAKRRLEVIQERAGVTSHIEVPEI